MNNVALLAELELDNRIDELFLEMGGDPNLIGYSLTKQAIKRVMKDKQIGIYYGLYPSIAEEFSLSTAKVERNIRHFIDNLWKRERINAINTAFGAKIYDEKTKPKNNEFIYIFADRLSKEYYYDSIRLQFVSLKHYFS